MKYIEYRAALERELRRATEGLTWVELRERLALPYERPCPAWTQQLEKDIGLSRVPGPGRRLLWRIASAPQPPRRTSARRTRRN